MSQQIYLVSDHAGFELKKEIMQYLDNQKNQKVIDLTPVFLKNDDYPDKAKVLARILENQDDAVGIAICGSGVGINIALNRFKHIRAVVGSETKIVKFSREDSNTNVLCLGERVIDQNLALELVEIFLNTKFKPEERHLRRIQKLS